MGISVTDTVESVTFNHRAGAAPLLTFLFCVIVCRHEVISSSSKDGVSTSAPRLRSRSRIIIQVHWDPCVIKRCNNETQPFYSAADKREPDNNNSCDYYCKEADGPARY